MIRNPRSGLSLFEALIALALLALLAGALGQAMGLGLRLLNRTAAVDAAHDPLAARIQLRRLLARALPPDRIAPFPVDFTGDADGFAFTTLTTHTLAPQAAALRITVRAEADRLVMQIAALDDAGTATPVLAAPLATGLANLRFAYGVPPQADWTEPARLPPLVQIFAERGSTPDWPDFAVVPTLAPGPPNPIQP